MTIKWHEIQKPQKECGDPKCPFHGKLRVRGQAFVGNVVSFKIPKSATVSWERRRLIKKFERYEIRRSKVAAYVPECINIKEGDKVIIMECRPLSKTKKFVVVKKLED